MGGGRCYTGVIIGVSSSWGAIGSKSPELRLIGLSHSTWFSSESDRRKRQPPAPKDWFGRCFLSPIPCFV